MYGNESRSCRPRTLRFASVWIALQDNLSDAVVTLAQRVSPDLQPPYNTNQPPSRYAQNVHSSPYTEGYMEAEHTFHVLWSEYGATAMQSAQSGLVIRFQNPDRFAFPSGWQANT